MSRLKFTLISFFFMASLSEASDHSSDYYSENRLLRMRKPFPGWPSIEIWIEDKEEWQTLVSSIFDITGHKIGQRSLRWIEKQSTDSIDTILSYFSESEAHEMTIVSKNRKDDYEAILAFSLLLKKPYIDFVEGSISKQHIILGERVGRFQLVYDHNSNLVLKIPSKGETDRSQILVLAADIARKRMGIYGDRLLMFHLAFRNENSIVHTLTEEIFWKEIVGKILFP